MVAALGHSGGQGSSAYSQLPLWAPSRVPEVNSREVPKSMEPDDIRAVIDGFALAQRPRPCERAWTASRSTPASTASCASSSPVSPTSATTSGDEDRLSFAREVLAATRRAAGAEAIVGLRLSCDELAPWAGIVPEAAIDIAVELVEAGSGRLPHGRPRLDLHGVGNATGRSHAAGLQHRPRAIDPRRARRFGRGHRARIDRRRRPSRVGNQRRCM